MGFVKAWVLTMDVSGFELLHYLIRLLGEADFSRALWNSDIPSLGAQVLQGGVAHIVSAALQTKGLIDQGKILSDLTTLNEIAGFFYLVAVCLAVGSVAVFGNYKQGLYLLIGPALYTFMVTTPAETNGVVAKLGNYEVPNSVGRQTKFLRHIRAIDDQNPNVTTNVSLFFATFDAIVSEVMQKVTSLILKTENREHLRIVGRERVLAHMLMSQPASGVLPRMVARHQKDCSHMMKEYYAAGKDTKEQAPVRFRNQGDARSPKQSADESWGQTRIMLGAPDTEIKRLILNLEGGNVSDERVRDDMPLSCKALWGFIMQGMTQAAEKALDPESYKGSLEQDDHEPKQEEFADAKEFMEEKSGGNATDTLAAFMYKQMLNQSTLSSLENHLYSNSPFNGKSFRAQYQDLPGAEARGAYFGLKYFATSIPYIQGLLLYLLAIAFPFFAILLVIPGKAMSFFMWCSLWVWAKSWDLGFALVLVARDMFWHMLKARTNTFENSSLDLQDPFSVYGLILNNDPLATMNTYWELSYALTVAVPFLTAHFCLGATNVFEMFRGSIDESANRFRTFETQSSRRAVANDGEASKRDNLYRYQMAYTRAALRNPSLDRDKGPYGAQTIFGESVGFDNRNQIVNVANWNRLSGARQGQAQVAWSFAGSMAQVGTREFTSQMDARLQSVLAFEQKANQGIDNKAERYTLPEGFNFENINAPVDAETLQKAASRKGSSIDTGKEYSWGQFVSQDARDQGQRLVIPSVMRGLPNMHESVKKEDLDFLYDSPDHKLKKAFESGQKVTWQDVFEQAHEDQRAHFNYIAAVTGRRYMPDAQTASTSFADAVAQAQAVGFMARTPMSGSKANDWNKAYTVPGMEFLIENFGVEVQPERPGLKDEALGDAGGSPSQDPTTP